MRVGWPERVTSHVWGLGALALGSLVAWLWVHSLREPDVLSAVDAETEYVSFVVRDPVRAAFFLPKTGAVAAAGWPSNTPMSGLFTPVRDAVISYRRNEKSSLTIEVSPPAREGRTGTLDFAPTDSAEKPFEFSGRVDFKIEIEEHKEPPRLPIWGSMSLGLEFAPPAVARAPGPRLLLSGKLTVSGVSSDDDETVLYRVAELDLPIGSRLSSSDVNGGAGPIWWGTVDAKADAASLSLRAVSETRRIDLFRPGRTDADHIVVSRTAKLTQDPRQLRTQLYALAIVGGFGLLLTVGQRAHGLYTTGKWFLAKDRPKYRDKGVPPLVIAAVILMAGSAQAQVVRLAVGDNRNGQGWLFWDTDRACKVVTARHVIAGVADSLRQPVLIDGRGVQHQTGAALVDSEEYDIAVLPVVASDPAAACGGGRLSVIGLERRVRTSTRVVIDTTGRSQVEHVPASLVAVPRDRYGGERMIVRLDGSSGLAREGWSGSVILDAEGPLGIVQTLRENSDTELVGLRMDVVRRLMDAAPTRPVSGIVAGRPIVEVTRGDAVSLETLRSGPGLEAGTGWRVKPVARQVGLTLTFPKPIELHGLMVKIDEAGSIDGVGVATIGDVSRPEAVGESVYVRSGSEGVYRLRLSPRVVQQLRITIGARGEMVDIAQVEAF